MLSTSEQKRQESCDRFNKYKSRLDEAAVPLIRALLHLVRPTEHFPKYSHEEIYSLWNTWYDEEKCFNHMTGYLVVTRVFPEIPPATAGPCCWRMWGLLIQEQVEGQDGQSRLIKECVLEIAANEECKKHPARCPCHLPTNPWTSCENVEALEPIHPKHNINCQCAGYKRCKEKEAAAAVAAAALKAAKAAEAAYYIEKGFPSEFCECQYHAAYETCGKPKKAYVDHAITLDAEDNLCPEMSVMYCGKEWRVERTKQLLLQEPLRIKVLKDFIKNLKGVKKLCGRDLNYIAEVENDIANGKAVGILKNILKKKEKSVKEMKSLEQLEPMLDGCYCGAETNHRINGTKECECFDARHTEWKEKNKNKNKNKPETVKHNVDECPCGTCYISRLESGTEDAYYKRVHEASMAAFASLPTNIETRSDESVTTAINPLGSVETPDLAKDIFAAMGTPHDSKCPHGMPFYSCMSCSH